MKISTQFIVGLIGILALALWWRTKGARGISAIQSQGAADAAQMPVFYAPMPLSIPLQPLQNFDLSQVAS